MLDLHLSLEPWALSWPLLAALLALLYVFWDVNYFLRIACTIGYAKLTRQTQRLTDTAHIYGLCTTNDVDIFFRHMNNARYVRELDFARFHFYETTGLYRQIVKAKATALQSASFIRYRRTIPIFTAYKVTTRLIYWEEKALYLEQQFVTLRDGFVRATVISKQNVLGMDVPLTVCRLAGLDPAHRPSPPPELEHLCRCIDVSSAKLRKKD